MSRDLIYNNNKDFLVTRVFIRY